MGATAAAQVRRQVRLGLVRRRLAAAARRVAGGSGPTPGPELPPAVFPVRLAGSRVVLRELAPGDVEGYVRLAGDPEVCRFMKIAPADEAAVVRSLAWKLLRARRPERSDYELAIEYEGRFVGTITLYLRGVRTAEIASWLLPEATGRGLAMDANTTMLRFGAESLDVHRVEATCDVENLRSLALIERLGMVREGCMRHAVHTHLGWRDRLLYARVFDEDEP